MAIMTEKVLKKLRKNPKAIFTYGELAEKLGTNARAIGQVMRAVYKVDPKLCDQVIYNPKTRVKEYGKRKKKKSN